MRNLNAASSEIARAGLAVRASVIRKLFLFPDAEIKWHTIWIASQHMLKHAASGGPFDYSNISK